MHSRVSTTRRQFVLTILRQIQTPQEVVDWFGCGHEKEKEKKTKKKCISVRVEKALLIRDPVRPGFES